MTFKRLSDRLLGPFEHLAAALSDPMRRDRAIAGTLIVYTAIWTLFAALSKATQAIHADPAEIAILGRALDWGSTKHPPALPALARAWFTIVPQTDFFFHLLAVSMASLAIYVTWRLAGLWLDREKRAAVPFLLMLIPSYNFLSLKFDHNTTQAAFWAIATYAVARSFLTRSIRWSIAAGAAAAFALLAKYWAAVLLGGLFIAVLMDRRRLAYFKSPAPWIAAAVTILCLAPHLLWLYRHDFPSLAHAIRHAPASWSTEALSLLAFGLSPVAYLAVPWVSLAISSWPRPVAWPDFFPSGDDRRFAANAYLAPFGVALLGAVLLHLRPSTLWTAPMLGLFPVVLLSPPLVVVSQRAVAKLAAAALALGLGALAVSPIVALHTLRTGGAYDATHMRLLSDEVTRAWRTVVTDRPIRLIAGPSALANVVAFYLPDRPQPLALFPRQTPELVVDPGIVRDGFVVVCPANDEYCSNALNGLSPTGRPTRRYQAELVPVWHGVSGVTRRFSISVFAPGS